MKKLSALLLAALLIFPSCTSEKSAPDQPDDGYDYNLDHISLEIPAGNVNTTLEEIASFGTYTGDGALSMTAPMTAVTKDKVYVLYFIPDEVVAAGRDAIRAHKGLITTMLVYPTSDLSAEPEEIPLQFPENAGSRWDMSVDEATGIISILGYADSIMQLQRYAPDGSLLSMTPYDIGEIETFTTWIRLVGTDVYFSTYPEDNYLHHTLWIWREGEAKPERIGERLSGYFVMNGSVCLVDGYNEDGTYNGEEILRLYDPDTGKKTTIHQFIHKTWDNFNTSAYDPETGRIWQGASDALYTCTVEPYSLTHISEGMGTFLEVRDVSHGILTVLNDYQKVTLYKVPDVPKDVTDGRTSLNFCRYADPAESANNDRADSALIPFQILLANGYNMKASTAYASNDTEEYTFTMAKKLMAGDTDFDLFYVTTEMSSLFKPGYFEDLSEYSILDEAYDLLMPGVRDICSIGGTEVLYPVHLSTTLLAADSTLSPEEFAMPATFGELMNLRTHPRTEGAYFMTGAILHNMMYPWFEQAISNFMASDAFDDVLYEDLVTLYRTGAELADDPDILIRYEASKKPTLITSNALTGMIEGFGEDKIVFPLVPVREEYRQTVSGEFWAINPNSPNKEAAAVWLTAKLREAYKSVSMGNASFFNADLTADNTSQADTILREHLPDSVRSYQFPDFRMYLYDWYKKIEKGEATPEQAAQKTYDYVKMSRDE